MKASKTEILASGVALATLAGVAYTGYQYRKHHKRYDRKFDPKSIEEVSGEVVHVNYSGRENGENRGLELILKTGVEMISVHLGPSWYMDRQHEKIKPGDKIKVKGSHVDHFHEPVLIAEEVQKGHKILRLRDPNGHPFWSAWDRLS